MTRGLVAVLHPSPPLLPVDSAALHPCHSAVEPLKMAAGPSLLLKILLVVLLCRPENGRGDDLGHDPAFTEPTGPLEPLF